MKNYPSLYYPLPKKLNKGQTPKKNTTIGMIGLSSKSSHQTLMGNSKLNRQKRPHVRTQARSIEQIHLRSQGQSVVHAWESVQGEDEEELFSRSYSKIGKIKQAFPYRSIDAELNQVLKLIREEKVTISERMKTLKKSNEEYKLLCGNYLKAKIDCAINTEEMIPSKNEIVSVDKSVECGLDEVKIQEQAQTDNSEKVQQFGVKNHEAYIKICKMLEEININPYVILPSDKQLPEEIVNVGGKVLGEKEIIKIQKFFIKKLIQKIPK